MICAPVGNCTSFWLLESHWIPIPHWFLCTCFSSQRLKTHFCRRYDIIKRDIVWSNVETMNYPVVCVVPYSWEILCFPQKFTMFNNLFLSLLCCPKAPQHTIGKYRPVQKNSRYITNFIFYFSPAETFYSRSPPQINKYLPLFMHSTPLSTSGLCCSFHLTLTLLPQSPFLFFQTVFLPS